jgi:hypothetical protein
VRRWRLLVFLFSCLVITSGLCCFMLEKRWLTGLTPAFKTPLYAMLGTSLCFAFTFSVVDLVNAHVCHCCNGAELYGIPPVPASPFCFPFSSCCEHHQILRPDFDNNRLVAQVQTSKQAYVVLIASVHPILSVLCFRHSWPHFSLYVRCAHVVPEDALPMVACDGRTLWSFFRTGGCRRCAKLA